MSANSDKVKIIFGLKIRQLRLDKKLSLSEVAEKSGLSRCFVIFRAKGFEQKYLRNTVYSEHHLVFILLFLLHWFGLLGITSIENLMFIFS